VLQKSNETTYGAAPDLETGERLTRIQVGAAAELRRVHDEVTAAY